MATKQSNWDWFNIATDLLSLLSAYGALRIVLAKGASLTARALAGVVLAKDATHYAMLSNGTLEKWHENGYGWLANLWIAFSVTVDLASFGLPNLSRIAKEGNAAAELSETAQDAKEIRRVANEAQRILNELGDTYLKLETKLAKNLGKDYDTFGNFEQVKAIEDIIRIQSKEFGMFFDGKGEALLDEIIIGINGSIDIDKSLMIAKKSIRDKGGRFTDLVFTHNHYGSSALSPSDILAAINNNLREVRAIGSSGVDYSLKRIRPYPIDKHYSAIIEKVNNKMQSKYPKLAKNQYSTGGGDIAKAQFYAETLLKQFQDYIEYTKFTK